MKKITLHSQLPAADIHIQTKAKKQEASCDPAQIEQAEKTAYERGKRDGIALAQEQSEQKIAALEQLLATIQTQLQDTAQQLHDQFTQQLQPHLIDLVLQIVEQLLQKQIATGQYQIDKIVAIALEEMQSFREQRMELRCHPQDAQTLVRVDLGKDIVVVDDATVAKADCVFHIDHCKVSVSLADRLQQIAQILRREEHREGETPR